MGTHKSKHNKGRKPLYKDFERVTVRHWMPEPKPLRERLIPNVPRRRARPPAAATLVEMVARYIEKRRETEARQEADKLFPRAKGPEFRTIDGTVFNPHFSDGLHDVVQSSERDVLLQLFIERKISAGYLHAGRRWQQLREQATIQPNMSIAWSQSIRRMPYQARGNLSDAQSSAMAYRRAFREYAGPAAVAFLDFCLDADRGRDDLTALLKMDRDQLAKVIEDALYRLCVFVGDHRARGAA
jgi:hypothetical protein